MTVADIKKFTDVEIFAEAKRRNDDREAREKAERLALETKEAAAQSAFLVLFLENPETILGIVQHDYRCTDTNRQRDRKCLRCALLNKQDDQWDSDIEPITLRFKSS